MELLKSYLLLKNKSIALFLKMVIISNILMANDFNEKDWAHSIHCTLSAISNIAIKI